MLVIAICLKKDFLRLFFSRFIRVTDGDGDPDVTDPDDDNDGIKDEDDKNPKTPDTNLPVITADDATVTEKAPISPIPVTVTDEDDETIAIDPNDVTGLPDELLLIPLSLCSFLTRGFGTVVTMVF